MNDHLRNHPLNGIGLDELLGDLVRTYGWDVLAEQLPISCFKNYPTFNSSIKFLRKTEWARERLEDLYLYKFLQYPLPIGEQQKIEPRNRLISSPRLSQEPATINLGDAEFFACPASKKYSLPRRSSSTASKRLTPKSTEKNNSSDPWAKWRKD